MNFSEQLQILEIAQGNDALLALATVDLTRPYLSLAERERLKEALLTAAIPHWCDRDTLTSLLNTTSDESETLLKYLKALTIVEPFEARGEGAFNVHETSRLALREYLRTTDPERWITLSTRARTWAIRIPKPHARIEALYHLFATDQQSAAEECEKLDRELYQQGLDESRSALALSLMELSCAGWLTGAAQVEALLTPLWVRSALGEAAQLEAEARKVVDLAKAASHESGIGRAQCLLGDVMKVRGKLNEAKIAFRDTLEIFKRLIELNPDNIGRQRDLSVAYSRIGDIHVDQGQLDAGLAAFQNYLIISKKLAEADGNSVIWQRGLAVAHSRIGDVHQVQENLDDALSSQREALSIFQRLTETDACNATWWISLARAHAKIGDIYWIQENFDKALVAFYEYLEITKGLSAQNMNNAIMQRELAVANSKVGDVYREQGKLDQAQAAYSETFVGLKQLAETDPDNSEWQSSLSIAYSKVGGIYEAQGKLDEALAAYRDDLLISKRLAESDESNAAWQHALATTLYRQGNLFEKMREFGKAKSSFRWALKAIERAAKMSPGNVGWQRDLQQMKRVLG